MDESDDEPSWFQRLMGKRSSAEIEAQEELTSLISHMRHDGGSLLPLAQKFVEAEKRARLSDRKKQARRVEAIRAAAERLLADDVLSVDEEEQFLAFLGAFGVQAENAGVYLAQNCADVLSWLRVAMYQDGRLPYVEQPRLITKAGEVVHIETAASLLKEVVHREYQGGYGGISFPIFPGVRMNTGSFRGRSVVVGTSLESADEGVLSITNTRVVFQGMKRNSEFRYDKLTGVDAYSDGIRLGVSNRQTASLYRLDDGPACAALILVAVQRALAG